MTTSLMTETAPAKQVAAAAVAAMPSHFSRRPAIGACGVILGAATVTLTGRLLGLGLDDLKGHLGLSYDDGAWIGTTFNTALMFIGPLTVYVGALLGSRRVLLGAAAAFALIAACLPLVHSYGLLIATLTLAGLTAGTFYPLTLTFALTSMPPRLLPFTLALYATAVDGAVNIAPSVYGLCRDHGLWQGMFWVPALVTLVMIACISIGLPAPPARRGGAVPSFAGFLYGSLGLAMVFAGLDQGQRLDWWRSGLVTALVAGGVVLLGCALVRHFRRPNPLVDAPYLGQWNIMPLGAVLGLFRFCLLATIVLVPQSLAIHGFVADQIGPALVGVAAPQLAIACIVAVLLLRNVDTRLILGFGFTAMAFACAMDARVTSGWTASNYFRSELLIAVGQSFAFVGLVSSLVLQAVFSGGLAKPQRVLTFSALFHTIRLFVGQVGVWSLTHFVAQREQFHSYVLGLHVQQGQWVTDGALRRLAIGLSSQSPGFRAATARAVGLVSGRVRLQAYTLAVSDGFQLVTWACIVALVCVALVRKAPMQYGQLADLAESRHS
jgi:MFS transporter, DHA2 family, multidrug resistance protein